MENNWKIRKREGVQSDGAEIRQSVEMMFLVVRNPAAAAISS